MFIAIIISVYLIIGLVSNLVGPLAKKFKSALYDLKYKDIDLFYETYIPPVPKQKLILFIVTFRLFILFAFPFLYSIIIIDNIKYRKRMRLLNIRLAKEKELSKKGLLFSSHVMGGMGDISCKECDFEQSILCSAHFADDSYSQGYQCQTCGKFHSINSKNKNLVCDCESKGTLSREHLLFCPKCKSHKLKYELTMMT
ncbi:MAG: hypothetical protein RLZZ175_3438 [Bacteroidota bacterium]|jgi:hypothetical protein